MICTKKGCKGFVSLEWSPDDIKPGLFVIEGECELCHAKYAVAMKMFEKSKLKNGSRLLDDLQVLAKCKDCMMCCSTDGGKPIICDDTQKRIKDPSKFPKWCPLPRLMP